MSLEDLLYKVHEKTEELYELAEEIEKQAFSEGIIENIETELVMLNKLIEGLDEFNMKIDIYGKEEPEPDWDLIRDERRFK